MINKKYLEQSLRIHKDYLNLDVVLKDIQSDLQSFGERLEEHKKELTILIESEDISEDELIRKSDEVLSNIALEEKVASDIYKPINERIERLKKEEVDLYNTLKSEYSHLSDDEIVKQVTDYVKSML